MMGRVISIELGMLTTRICEVEYHKKMPKVYQCISFDTPPGSIEDGYVCNTQAITEALNYKLKEGGFKSKGLVFTIASSKIASREVSIPYVSKQKIDEIVKANSSEYFPVDISGFIIRYIVLEKYTAEGEKRLRLLILAVPENMVKSYFDIAAKLGSTVAAIDYIGNSIYQTVRHMPTDIRLLVHISEQMTFLNIMENGVISLPKTVHFGVINILEAIRSRQEAAGNEEEDLQPLTGDKPTIWQQDSSLLYLINSIQRIIDFYSRNQEKKIQAIWLTGQVSGISGLKEHLQNELGLQIICQKAEDFFQFHNPAPVSDWEKVSYAACIGAAVAPIGFLPKDHLDRNRKNNNLHNLIFTITAGALVSGILVGTSYFSYQTALIKNRVLSGELSALVDINSIYEEYNSSAGQLKELNSLYALTTSPNEHILELLAQLESKLPLEASVETMSTNSQGITLSVRADSEITAAMTLKQLKTIPYLTKISTDAISISTDENGIMTVYFVINGTYNQETLQEVGNGTAKENIGS